MEKAFEKGLKYVLVTLMAIMTVNVVWQVASRYLLDSPNPFTEELARFLLIWIGLLGAAYTDGKGGHLAIDLLKNKTLGKVVNVLVFGFALTVLVIGGIRQVYISFHLGQTSSALQIPFGYVYLVIPLSGLIICYYELRKLIKD